MQDDILACLLFLPGAQSENIDAPLSTRDSPTLRPCRTPVHALHIKEAGRFLDQNPRSESEIRLESAVQELGGGDVEMVVAGRREGGGVV